MEITKTDVEKLIEIKQKDTFLNHWLNVFLRDFRVKGEISRNKILIWKQGFWNMTFYPVFIFEFNANMHLIKISDKQNPIGKTVTVIAFLPMVFVVLSQLENGFLESWKAFLFIGIFIALLVLFARKVYHYEKQNQLEFIYETLDIEVENKKTAKEYTIKKFLTRLVLYPVCIGLIFLAIFLLIPNNEIIMSIGALAISIAYLFSDLKILNSKKNNRQHRR